jgi:hypothetical protein
MSTRVAPAAALWQERPMAKGTERMRRAGRLSVLALAMAGAACGSAENFRESIGLSVPPPDEYLVVAREPLAMPPSLDVLPVPQPGAPSRTTPNPRNQAQQALAGGAAAPAAAGSAVAPSASEQALIASAGQADPAIRDTLRAEATADTGPRRFGLDSFFGIPIVQNPGARPEPFDAVAEAERLRDAGLPVPATPPEMQGTN